jgi:hypothetical protein
MVQLREVAGANIDQRLRRCVRCRAEFSTFEVIGGTEVTWETVDDEGWPARTPWQPFEPTAPAAASDAPRGLRAKDWRQIGRRRE